MEIAAMEDGVVLLDAHGRVLCADNTHGLRFRTPHPAMLPDVVRLHGPDNVLTCGRDPTPRALAFAQGRLVLSALPPVGKMRVERPAMDPHGPARHDAGLHIVCGGFVLSSDPNGVASFKTDRAGWEIFHPLGTPALSWLAAALTHGLDSTTLDRFVPGADIRLENGILSYADLSFDLSRQTRLDPSRRRAALVYGDACLDPVRVRNPLIYYSVFGVSALLDTLALAIRSVEHFGAIAPHYLILTNLPEDAVRAALDMLPACRLSVLRQSILTTNDILLARYRIADWPDSAAYSPILYLDLDMVCTTSLAPLLDGIARSPVLCCNSEGDRGAEHHVWFGAHLFAQDAGLTMAENRFVNSGAIGVPHIDLARDIFADTCLVGTEMSHRHRDGFEALDQPCFGYVLSRTAAFATETITRAVVNWPAHQFADIPRIGLVHFCGGVGGFTSKHEQMAAYLRFIGLPDAQARQEKGAADP